MGKVLNIITFIFGALLVVSGIVKLLSIETSFNLEIGTYSPVLGSFSSPIYYTLFINILGGSLMALQAIKTMRYKITRSKVKNSKGSESKFKIEDYTPPSKLVLFSMFATLFTSIWLLMETGVLVSGFSNQLSRVLPFLLAILAIQVPFGLFPLLLSIRNLSLASKFTQHLENNRKAELRLKLQARKKASPTKRR